MALKEQLMKFGSETSIHAFGYMAQSSASSAKRFFWICLFTGALTYATLQIKTVVECKSSIMAIPVWLKINCSQMRSLNFANWCNGEVSNSTKI